MRFPERQESGRPKVINKTGRHGNGGMLMRCHLGESGAGWVRLTPIPQARSVEPESSPGVTMSRVHHLNAIRNAVYSATKQVHS